MNSDKNTEPMTRMFLNLVMKHIKMIVFFCITFNVILVSGSSLSDQVHQTPADMYKKPEDQAEIKCSHSIQNYDQILWYKQLEDRQLQFLGYMSASNGFPETGMGVKIEGNADKGQTCTLTIEGLNLNSSAVYFCAGTGVGSGEAFFGGGTKLTVLEKEAKAPTVKVLPPSPKECRKQEHRRKTLVCVATGFYPDHVSVFWQINGVNVTNGVATDNTARWDGNYYNITSRLRVSANDWYTPDSRFTCIVSFFDGKETKPYQNSIFGEKATEVTMTRGKYLKITNNAKLSYGVFIVKSSVYGAFVVFLVWKLQGKHN